MSTQKERGDGKVSRPRCPRCGTPQTAEQEQTTFFCNRCRMEFDNDPDEGGDYSSRNPAARMERQERRRSRSREYGADRVRRGPMR